MRLPQDIHRRASSAALALARHARFAAWAKSDRHLATVYTTEVARGMVRDSSRFYARLARQELAEFFALTSGR